MPALPSSAKQSAPSKEDPVASEAMDWLASRRGDASEAKSRPSAPHHGRAAEEVSQVSSHPKFMSNPLGAIAQHLQATLPPPPTKRELLQRQRVEAARKKAKRKKARGPRGGDR